MEKEEASNDMALEKITSEVDETETKVFFSSYCLEAQEYLAAKLKKRCEHHRETCSFINSTNFKVEAEIKHAEQEIRSMLISQESLKLGNVELRKQCLLATNKKADIMKRIKEGKIKYEAQWLQTKNRYESIPFVKKLIQATERQNTAQKTIDDMDEQISKLYDDLKTKRKICDEIDKKRCIELANFMVNDMPRAINFIEDKSKQIQELNTELEQLVKDKNVEVKPTTETAVTSNVIGKVKIDKLVNVKDKNILKTEHDPLIPKLNLVNIDLEIMGTKLNQAKIKKDEILNAATSKINYSIIRNREQNVEQRDKDEKAYGYLISPYFSPYKEEKTRNYSGRKLINILEDISINNSEAYNIVKKVQSDKLKTVGEISAETIETANNLKLKAKDKVDKPIVSEEIEEVDLTSSCADKVLVPPTQFLDISISDANQKKKVLFDLPSSLQIKEITEENMQDEEELNESVNQTMTSHADVSGASDDSLIKTKEMLLKQHNLDLSPQFVYAKTNVLQTRNDDKIVASKFFQGLNKEKQTGEINDIVMDSVTVETLDLARDTEANQQKDLDMAMDVNNAAVASPTSNQASLKNYEDCKSAAPVAGLLFTHGSQAITDSLNVSLSTVGYEESDYPHCIDTNLLLSPKADVQNSAQNQDVSSQEVPNFLSGFRKTFFFGGPSTSSEPKPDSSEQNEDNNFTFNFGGTKKNRGGAFSLFG